MIFALCGELLVVFYRKVVQDLNALMLPSTIQIDKERLFDILNGLEPLSRGTLLLHQRFYLIIITSLCLTISNKFTYSYYLIDNWGKNRIIGVFWEVICLFHSVINLWIICHTTDRIRVSVRLI